MTDFSPAPKPEDGKLGIEWHPWYRVFYQNLRDSVFPPKLPPLKLTSRPVKVQSIWSRDAAFGPSQLVALVVHVALIVLLLVPLYSTIVHPPATVNGIRTQIAGISPFTWRLPAGENPDRGGGSGGDQNPIPPSTGKPSPFALVQLTPPTVTIRNLNPEVTAPPTLVGDPNLKFSNPNLTNIGDPQETTVTNSNGPGTGDGIGTRHGTGIGDGDGPGLGPGEGGNTGGEGVPYAGGCDYGSPSCVYCPDPKYSDAARQVKFMGTVIVQLIVNADGRPSDIVVIKDPGMGLGEKAVEAVRTWQFRPALGPNRKPAATRINIEVQFRLL